MKILDTQMMHPMDQINSVIGKIYRDGLTTTSGGNISIKDDNGDIWITPSGVDKGSLTRNDIVCIKKDGTIVGPHKPSSEHPFHRAIYESRPDLKAIIHAHPPALVAFSITNQLPDTKIAPNTYNNCGTVGFAPYGCPGSEELGQKIAEVFKNKKFRAVIMENHGVVLGGSDLLDAYMRFETLEYCSRTIASANRLGKVNYLNENAIANYTDRNRSSLNQFHGVSYPSDERALRTEITNIVRRACTQGLMLSSYGTASARWQNNDFLITPRNVARWDILPNDVVQIKNGAAEAGKTPDDFVELHQLIYQMNPHINSIIFSQSVNLMAHAISGTKFNVRTIPESWIFLQDVPAIPFNYIFEKTEEVAAAFNNHRVILVENMGVFVTGDKLLNTFDYLEVAEFSAHSLVMATSIGAHKPMGDKEIEELRIAFNVK